MKEGMTFQSFGLMHPYLHYVGEYILSFTTCTPPDLNIVTGLLDLLVEPAVSLTARVTRSDTSSSIPQGVLPGYSVLIVVHKPTLTVVVTSKKGRHSLTRGGPSSGTGAAIGVCLRVTYCICPQMSAWDSIGNEHTFSIVCVNAVSVECIHMPKLVPPHSTTHMGVVLSGREHKRGATSANTLPTGPLFGCGVGDLVETTWTPSCGISHVNVSNTSPLSAVDATLDICR